MKKYFSLSLVVLGTLVGVVAVAQATTTEATSSPVVITSPVVTPTSNADCMVMAVDKRETSIIFARQTLEGEMLSALEVRREALKNAWSQKEGKLRRDQRKVAWDNFANTRRLVRQTYGQAVKKAWSIFSQDSKACRVPVVESSGLDTNP